jgi:isoleucyl-tRNA synthetase
VPLVEGEYALETVVAGDGTGSEAVAVLPSGGFVVLDLDGDAGAGREGLARDLVRAVQQVRRDAGLAVGDRILLTVAADDDDVLAAVEEFGAMLARETLALDVRTQRETLGGLHAAGRAQVTLGDGRTAVVKVDRRG